MHYVDIAGPCSAIEGVKQDWEGAKFREKCVIISKRQKVTINEWLIGGCICAFDWHQDRWPRMTSNCYKFEFLENFADLGGNNCWTNEYRLVRIVGDSIVTHWIGLSSVLRPRQHSIGYMGDGFYRSKDPTNSIKVLMENLQRKTTQRKKTKNTHMHTHTK